MKLFYWAIFLLGHIAFAQVNRESVAMERHLLKGKRRLRAPLEPSTDQEVSEHIIRGLELSMSLISHDISAPKPIIGGKKSGGGKKSSSGGKKSSSGKKTSATSSGTEISTANAGASTSPSSSKGGKKAGASKKAGKKIVSN